MRGKIAKALRRAAREAMPGALERETAEIKKHLKRYPQLVKTSVDANGNSFVVDPGIREVCQHVNSAISTRGLYRQMKKDYYHA